MTHIFSKNKVTHVSLNRGLLILFTFTSKILLLLNSNHSIQFADCLARPKHSSDIAGRSIPVSSRRDTRPNAISKSVQEASKSQTTGKERTTVILYNKPPDTITSHQSQDSRMTVYEDIQSMRGFLFPSPSSDIHSRELRGNSFKENKCDASSSRSSAFEDATGIRSKLHAIGRLDANTTGLLLLTNDGGLVHHVTNPEAKDNPSDGIQSTKNIIKKTYQALIMGHHTESSLLPIRTGIDIGKGYVTKKLVDEDDLQILEHPNHKSTIVSITIGEGKNRQVRKMFHAIGSGVMKLKRTRIGEHLTLDGVKEGEWRVLTDDEVQRYLSWKPRDINASSILASRPSRKGRRAGSLKSKRRRRRK